MARLDGPERKSPLVRLAYWFARRKLGAVPTPLRITANHPRLLRAYASMELGQEASRAVDAPLKILAQVLVAMRVGCPF